MADFGILFRNVGDNHANSKLNRETLKAWDAVCVYPANKCAHDPSHGSPHSIIVVRNAPDGWDPSELTQPRRVQDLSQPIDDLGHQPEVILARSVWALNPNLLPETVRDTLMKKGRVVCQYSDFEVAIIHKAITKTLKENRSIKANKNGN